MTPEPTVHLLRVRGNPAEPGEAKQAPSLSAGGPFHGPSPRLHLRSSSPRPPGNKGRPRGVSGSPPAPKDTKLTVPAFRTFRGRRGKKTQAPNPGRPERWPFVQMLQEDGGHAWRGGRPRNQGREGRQEVCVLPFLKQKKCTAPGWQELHQQLLEVHLLFFFALGVSDAGRPPLRRLPALLGNLLPLHPFLGFISSRNITFTKRER